MIIWGKTLDMMPHWQWVKNREMSCPLKSYLVTQSFSLLPAENSFVFPLSNTKTELIWHSLREKNNSKYLKVWKCLLLRWKQKSELSDPRSTQISMMFRNTVIKLSWQNMELVIMWNLLMVEILMILEWFLWRYNFWSVSKLHGRRIKSFTWDRC